MSEDHPPLGWYIGAFLALLCMVNVLTASATATVIIVLRMLRVIE